MAALSPVASAAAVIARRRTSSSGSLAASSARSPSPSQAAGRCPLLGLDDGKQAGASVGGQRAELAVHPYQCLEAPRRALHPERVHRPHRGSRQAGGLGPQRRYRQAGGDGVLGGGECGGTGQGDTSERRGEHRPIGGRRRDHRRRQGVDRLHREHFGGVGGGNRGAMAYAGIGIRQQRDDLTDERRRFEPSHGPHRLDANAGTGVLEPLGEHRLRRRAQLTRIFGLEDPRRQCLPGGADRKRGGEHDGRQDREHRGTSAHTPSVAQVARNCRAATRQLRG
jgi:hypothetical protein